ncbi:flagellar export chaperone FliS [Sedimentibacter sp. zth1]|uniref:flagellar export chaperone FliS n=1 Tax=Sedimentibacter sp. zth1 TaxID=2816908 RepID=UPI001A90E5F3|nr:flagellar export chaperone FliS [Sedimentibacter sp. zth1]QSX07166.1 flagellar export chaperone FliS [Sedimentibacter sp. zth1]
MNDPYKNYKDNSINTMTRGEQLILLLDKAVQRLTIVSLMMEDGNFTEAIINLNKTRDIFNYLMACLDKKFEFATDLLQLYSFINAEIVKAAGKKDKTAIDNLIPIVIELRDTWKEAEKLARINK